MNSLYTIGWLHEKYRNIVPDSNWNITATYVVSGVHFIFWESYILWIQLSVLKSKILF